MPSFHTDAPSPFVSGLLTLLGSFCGVTWIETTPGSADEIDVYYGDNPEVACGLRIPTVGRYDLDSVPAPQQLDQIPLPPTHGGQWPFDLVAACRFWLQDEGHAHRTRQSLDGHERLLAAGSCHERRGTLGVPVVNVMLEAFKTWLARRLSRPLHSRLLPPGKRCAVILSHDVDDPVDPWRLDYKALQVARSVANREVERGLRSAFRETRRLGQVLARGRPMRHWLFEDIIRSERQRGFHSTFFFAPTPFTRPGSSYLDVPYDVQDPPFQRAMDRIQEQGHEVGLHIGYNTFHNPHQELLREARLLRTISGAPILGSRHHFWRMGWPFWDTLAAHHSAGLAWDTSLAFNDHPGFRLGLAWPWRPVHPGTGATIQTLQIPCMAMDTATMNAGGGDVTQALSVFQGLIQQLKDHSGIAALDWHVRTSWPGNATFMDLGLLYQKILDLLASDSQIAVLSGAQLWELWQDADAT